MLRLLPSFVPLPLPVAVQTKSLPSTFLHKAVRHTTTVTRHAHGYAGLGETEEVRGKREGAS